MECALGRLPKIQRESENVCVKCGRALITARYYFFVRCGLKVRLQMGRGGQPHGNELGKGRGLSSFASVCFAGYLF